MMIEKTSSAHKTISCFGLHRDDHNYFAHLYMKKKKPEKMSTFLFCCDQKRLKFDWDQTQTTDCIEMVFCVIGFLTHTVNLGYSKICQSYYRYFLILCKLYCFCLILFEVMEFVAFVFMNSI